MKPSQCAEKRREYSQRYRARHYDRVLARERARRATPEGRAKQRGYYNDCQSKPEHRMQRLITKAKTRAIARGLPYSDALFARIKASPPTNCACCGRLFDYAVSKGHSNDSASFDRVNNDLGYTEDNMSVICRRCNRIKGDATAEELDAIARYIRKHHQQIEAACVA